MGLAYAYVSMSIEHAVLGLLAEGPRHGYALRALLETRLGSDADLGGVRIYRILERLEGAGLVTSATQRMGRRRRRVYALRPEGHRELQQWPGDGPVYLAGRPDLFLRLSAAGGDVARVATIVEVWEREERRALARWRDARWEPEFRTEKQSWGRRLAIELEVDRARSALRTSSRVRGLLEGDPGDLPFEDVLRALRTLE